MKMVDTGQTSSDGPAVVPQTEWNLDEEQKDLRRESKKKCKWFKANLIIQLTRKSIADTAKRYRHVKAKLIQQSMIVTLFHK